MLYAKGICKFFNGAKRCDKWVGIGIGHLQAHTQHHRENEEQCHLFLLEEPECFETQGLYQIYVTLVFANLACGQRERIDGQ